MKPVSIILNRNGLTFEVTTMDVHRTGTPKGYVKLILDNGYSARAINKIYSIEFCIDHLTKKHTEKQEYGKWQEMIKAMSVEEFINSEWFAYARWKDYGIALYARDKWSPTGVGFAKGIPHEDEKKYPNLRTLSPTEDLRTAR